MASTAPGARRGHPEPLFYRLVLPILIALNLALAGIVLSLIGPSDWRQWLELGTGGFCCVLSGWLLGAWWSRRFWRSSIAGQLSTWQRVVDELFLWIEDLPIDSEDLTRLRRLVDRIIPSR
jgi:hypothetical protein